MKVVIDTNVLIASMIGQSPTLRRILEGCYQHEIQLVLSKALLWEIGRVLHKPKLVRLHRMRDAQISMYLQSLAAIAEFVPGSTAITVSPDEADNALFICAVEAHADYIISGDKHHVLASIKGCARSTPLTS
jgi:uncharacterized protein